MHLFTLIAFLLGALRAISSNDSRTDPLLQTSTMLTKYGSTESQTSQSRLMDIPDECWMICLEFASHQNNVVNSRLLSRRHSNAYDQFMHRQWTRNLCHLLVPHPINRRYQTMDDIQQSIILIPGAFMDFNSTSNVAICSLGRFHAQSKRHIVRGTDMSSKNDFLSILLRSDHNHRIKLLLLCEFDYFGMSSSRFFVHDQVIMNRDGPDTLNLQRLLVEEHGEFPKIRGVWTMESESKQCFRKTGYVLKQSFFCLLYVTFIVLGLCVIVLWFNLMVSLVG